MQFRVASGFLIFIGSYLPLAIILAAQDIKISWFTQPNCNNTVPQAITCTAWPFNHPGLALGFICITSASALIAHFSLKAISYPFQFEVTQSKAIPNEIINYTFPYVVSFMGINYNEPEKLFGFLTFLLWMFAITYKSGQIIMNPLLLMFGWRLYDASIVINGAPRDTRILKIGNLPPGTYQGDTVQDFYIARD